MTDLSEYEQERLARIQDNQKFLQSLGLGLDKKNGIFTEEVPKKLKKKKETVVISEDFVPRRSNRARHSTGNLYEGEDVTTTLEEAEKTKHRKKKAKDLSVRVVWSRTYDPVNGTTCHQCRQKTLELKVACTNTLVDSCGNKQMCNVKLDEACLTNRYGQTIQAALASGEWKCPKCLGICNCSSCRRKKGLVPVGTMAQKVRAAGFNSVDSYLRNTPKKSENSQETQEPQETKETTETTKTTETQEKQETQETQKIPKLILPNILRESPANSSYDFPTSPDSSSECTATPLSDSSLSFYDTPDLTPSTPKTSPSTFDSPTTPYQPPPIISPTKLTENTPKKLPTIRILTKGPTMVILDNDKSSVVPITTPSPESEPCGADELEVDKILDLKVAKVGGKDEILFLIKWKGATENSWETRDNLFCHDMLEEFLQVRIAQLQQESKEEEDKQKKISPPKRKHKHKESTSKEAKKMKQEKEAQVPTTPQPPSKEKRANRGNRSAHLSGDFQFF